jgi:transposase
MIQTLFPNSDALFPDNTAPIHTAGTLSSLFEEHEGERQHLPWPGQPPDLNIIEPLWSVLETRMRNSFPLPKSLQQRERVLQEEWHKIWLETVQNLYEFIPIRIAAVLMAKGGPIPY